MSIGGKKFLLNQLNLIGARSKSCLFIWSSAFIQLMVQAHQQFSYKVGAVRGQGRTPQVTFDDLNCLWTACSFDWFHVNLLDIDPALVEHTPGDPHWCELWRVMASMWWWGGGDEDDLPTHTSVRVLFSDQLASILAAAGPDCTGLGQRSQVMEHVTETIP